MKALQYLLAKWTCICVHTTGDFPQSYDWFLVTQNPHRFHQWLVTNTGNSQENDFHSIMWDDFTSSASGSEVLRTTSIGRLHPATTHNLGWTAMVHNASHTITMWVDLITPCRERCRAGKQRGPPSSTVVCAIHVLEHRLRTTAGWSHKNALTYCASNPGHSNVIAHLIINWTSVKILERSD